MTTYLGAVWRCRFFWLSLVKMDLRLRYRGSALGIGWSLLQPIAMTIILCTVFGRLFTTNWRDFAPYLMAGLTFWSYISGVTVGGCHCFFQGEAYIRQHPAPMAIYPLRNMLAASFHFSIALLMVVVLGRIVRPTGNPLALLSLVPTFGLLMILGWSLATLFGLANVRFRDTNHLTEIALQILFYITPVMYPEDLLAQKNMAWVMDFNPIVPFLTLLREPLTHDLFPRITTFLAAVAITAVLATMASFALKSEERKLIFHL